MPKLPKTCPRCDQKLSPLTAVVSITKSSESLHNDKKVRRGMTNHRACYNCNSITNIITKEMI